MSHRWRARLSTTGTKRPLSIALATLSAISVLLVGTSGVSSAAPRSDIAQVEAQVRGLEMQAGAAHEEATRAEVELGAVEAQLEAVRAKLARQRQDLTMAESVVGDIARNLYTSGGLDPSLQVLLSDDPTAFLAQSAVLGQMTDHQAAQIRRVMTSRVRLAQTQAAISDKEARAKKLAEERSAAESRVASRLAQAKAVLASLQAAERGRLARLQAQRRAQQRAEAQQARRWVPWPSEASAGGGTPAVSQRAQLAVQYALSQVGAPYSYSARPPSSWDCSKLTSAAWAKAGVGLTALSYTQWDQTRRVPVSDIRPGDLVFYFGSGAHHVAIYVGNGMMVSASNPSDGVELIGFLSPWYKERFSGVGRIIG